MVSHLGSTVVVEDSFGFEHEYDESELLPLKELEVEENECEGDVLVTGVSQLVQEEDVDVDDDVAEEAISTTDSWEDVEDSQD